MTQAINLAVLGGQLLPGGAIADIRFLNVTSANGLGAGSRVSLTRVA